MKLKEKLKNASIILYLTMRMIGSFFHMIRLLFVSGKSEIERR